MKYDPPQFEWKPRSFVTDPPGPYVQVIRDAWWLVNESGDVLFYKAGGRLFPQCNSNELIVLKMAVKNPLTPVLERIPLAFVPIELEDFR